MLGSVPAYVNAVGGPVDGVTYFVGSIFFTSASLLQLLQAQSPAMTDVDAAAPARAGAGDGWWAWLPHDRSWLAAVTQFPGTLFFNISTFAALVHNATVQRAGPARLASRLLRVDPVPRGQRVRDPRRSGRFLRLRPGSLPWRIAWFNMVGSVLFMASALASYVLPSTGEVIDTRVTVAGTLLGAVCFLVGAALMFPAWRRFVHEPRTAPAT